MDGTDNLFETTRNFLTPASVQRFSEELDEPTDKVQEGLRSVIPTFLSELINKGSTSEGAQTIVHLVESENFDTEIPSDFHKKDYLLKGEHAVEDIFGEGIHSIAKELTPTTGLQTGNVEKMMEMIAPVVMGVVGNKIKNEGMTASGLSGFLQEQKKVLKGFEARRTEPVVKESFERPRRKAPFGLLAALIVLSFGALFWLVSKNSVPVSQISKDIKVVERPADQVPAIIQLPQFVETASKGDLPKTFLFKTVAFKEGTTDMLDGGDQELDIIAATLKKYPRARVTIEGYIEETEDDEENLLLSENRAMLVREELIGRGIEPLRIKAEGKGPALDHQQVQMVVTSLK